MKKYFVRNVGKMSLLSKIGWGIIIGFTILYTILWAFTMAEWDIKTTQCAEEYGGKVIRGYCTYVEDGTSKSFSIWDNNALGGNGEC